MRLHDYLAYCTQSAFVYDRQKILNVVNEGWNGETHYH